MSRFSILALSLVLLTAAFVLAADGAKPAASAPTSAPAAKDDGTPGKATVVSVTGTCQKLLPSADGKQAWQPIRQGDQLDERTVIRTGLRSKVVLHFEDRAELVVNEATKVGISDFRQRGQMVRTKLGLKYGTVHADVDPNRGPTSFQIATPVATLSIRGTAGMIGFFSDSGMHLSADHGRWHAANGAGGSRNVVGGEQTNGHLAPSMTLTQQHRDTYANDFFGGVDSSEQNFLVNNGQGRGIFLATGTRETVQSFGGGVPPNSNTHRNGSIDIVGPSNSALNSPSNVVSQP